MNICGQNGLQKQANVLLDTGAQISLIRNDIADLLGLVRKYTHITVTKVGGEGETMKTKVYKVPICTTKSGKTYTVKAIGFIDQIGVASY